MPRSANTKDTKARGRLPQLRRQVDRLRVPKREKKRERVEEHREHADRTVDVSFNLCAAERGAEEIVHERGGRKKAKRNQNAKAAQD